MTYSSTLFYWHFHFIVKNMVIQNISTKIFVDECWRYCYFFFRKLSTIFQLIPIIRSLLIPPIFMTSQINLKWCNWSKPFWLLHLNILPYFNFQKHNRSSFNIFRSKVMSNWTYYFKKHCISYAFIFLPQLETKVTNGDKKTYVSGNLFNSHTKQYVHFGKAIFPCEL